MSERSKDDRPLSNPNDVETGESWVEWAKILGVSVVLAIGIRHFLAESRFIPTESMVPTLLIDDRLIVEKVTYRFRSPQRGEVVVFRPPVGLQRQQPNFDDALIKRVIGLPGETVAISGGQVFINGAPLPESYIAEPPNYPWGPNVIPEGQYFVLGDNRNRSNDSHAWGYVAETDIIGRATVRFWPLGRMGGINPSELYPGFSTPAAPPTSDYPSQPGDRPLVAALPFDQEILNFALTLQP